jgi:hypothetical protein
VTRFQVVAATATAPKRDVRSRVEGLGSAGLAAGLTLYASFNAGGYFADAVGVTCAFLLALLALRVAVVARPFEGFSRTLAFAAGALALFAGWSLVSLAWSHAPGRAILELDRILAFVLTLVAFGSAPWSSVRMRRTVYGIALAAVVVAVAALASRLAPDVFPTAPNIVPDRLSFPLTYWNALALLAGIGLTLCLHIASDAGPPPLGRAAAAAAVPLLAVTLLLTYSRGGVAVTVAMLVAYFVLARPAGAAVALLAAGPPTAVALIAAYGADKLASTDPTSSPAAGQGHRVAAVAVASALAGGALRLVLARRGADRLRVPTLLRARLSGRRARWAVAVAVAAVLAVPVVIAVVHQVNGFSARPSSSSLSDTRNRLTDPSSNGRVDYWRAALDAFGAAPIHGTGAGTYQLEWWRHRPVPATVTQAHSLYLQALGEVGLVGLALLLAGLAPMFRALVRRMRGADRAPVAALVACAGGWALHAAFDWDWQVPAVTLWLFAVGGIALARAPRPDGAGRSLGVAPRAVVGVLLICAAGFPALVAVSQSKLDDALNAYDRGDCPAAADAARTARAAMAPRAEPRAVLGWCAARSGHWAEAEADLRAAVSRDPQDWEDRYDLAVVLAAEGRDPRPDAAAAARLDPLEPAVRQAVAAFAAPDPATWKRRALEARLFVDGLDYPPLAG